ncbi:uncharacterized protein LOC117183025 [Belonocnema kinseyi]|uniref:uncharacterized protein LOC117183025 n=1 Tax=Belonocnema kinseyi TaxID=2817044 RepID=UPI00143D6653|nr:uncharacterized protein LOC117183025 [Belonocnema kinseyi]
MLQTVRDEEELPKIGRTSFYHILQELNFTYVKRKRNSFLTERDDLIKWRRVYLENIRQYRAEGWKIYYLDETWVNAGDVTNKVWYDKSIQSARDAFIRGLSTGPPIPSGKGKSLIALHIDSTEGFVDGGFLCFESKKNSADYHDELNGYNFKQWFVNILPSLRTKPH